MKNRGQLSNAPDSSSMTRSLGHIQVASPPRQGFRNSAKPNRAALSLWQEAGSIELGYQGARRTRERALTKPQAWVPAAILSPGFALPKCCCVFPNTHFPTCARRHSSCCNPAAGATQLLSLPIEIWDKEQFLRAVFFVH